MNNPFTTTDQVNAVIKIRRGPEIDRANTVYEDGELVYSTDKKRLFIGDGFSTNGNTPGGNIVGNKIWYTDNFEKLSSIEVNDLVYRTDFKALYLLYGNNPLLSSSYVLVGGLKMITENVNLTPYTLPDATDMVKGGIKTGLGLVASNGLLNINYDPNIFTIDLTNNLTLKNASTVSLIDASHTAKGVVQIFDGSNGNGGLEISNGQLWVNLDNQTVKLNTSNQLYVDKLSVLNPATTTALGGIKVGKALSATSDGTLSVGIDNNTIKINGSNNLYVAAGGGGGTTTSFTINDGINDLAATKLVIGDGLDLADNGSSATISLPIAKTSTIGGVKVPNAGGLSLNTSTGILSVGVDNTSIKINASNQLTFDPNTLSSVFTNVLAQNGGINIAGIVGLQWGKASFSGSTTASVSFTPFRTNCYSVVATQASGTTPVAIRVSSVTRSGCTLNIAAAATMDCYWVAIGDN